MVQYIVPSPMPSLLLLLTHFTSLFFLPSSLLPFCSTFLHLLTLHQLMHLIFLPLPPFLLHLPVLTLPSLSVFHLSFVPISSSYSFILPSFLSIFLLQFHLAYSLNSPFLSFHLSAPTPSTSSLSLLPFLLQFSLVTLCPSTLPSTSLFLLQLRSLPFTSHFFHSPCISHFSLSLLVLFLSRVPLTYFNFISFHSVSEKKDTVSTRPEKYHAGETR